MAYREKTAWLTLACMGIAYSIYFALVVLRPVPMTLFDILWTFGTVSATQAVVVIVGSIALALNAGPAANRQADERDRAIARRGANAAYYVLMVAMILVGVVMPFGDPAPKTVNTALLGLVTAEAVRLVVILVSYRRGWHG